MIVDRIVCGGANRFEGPDVLRRSRASRKVRGLFAPFVAQGKQDDSERRSNEAQEGWHNSSRLGARSQRYIEEYGKGWPDLRNSG